MNPIKKAIEEVKYRIPRQLLERVFINGSSAWRVGPKSNLDDQILNLVVRPRVMVDCNLIGGTQALIPLDGLAQDKPEDWLTVVHIPKSRTDGRSINSVLDVVLINNSIVAGYTNMGATGMGSMNGMSGGFSAQDGSAMTSALASAVAAQDKIPLVSTSRVSLIAENTIMIRDGVLLPPNTALRCVLANDENMSGLQLRSYRYFSNLIEFAVKSYIYKELVIEVDVAELRYGQAVGAFKDVYSSYSDAEANYQDYLTNVWEQVAFMNDAETYSRFIRMHISANS